MEIINSSLTRLRLPLLRRNVPSLNIWGLKKHLGWFGDFPLWANFHIFERSHELRLWRLVIFDEFPMDMWRMLSHRFNEMCEKQLEDIRLLASTVSLPFILLLFVFSCTSMLRKLFPKAFSSPWLLFRYAPWGSLTYVAEGGKIFRWISFILQSDMIFIFELVTAVERQAWQFVVSFPSGNRTAEDPGAGKDGDFAALSLNDLFNLYCFREVLRDVAIVSIDCFWVEEEKSSFPDPGRRVKNSASLIGDGLEFHPLTWVFARWFRLTIASLASRQYSVLTLLIVGLRWSAGTALFLKCFLKRDCNWIRLITFSEMVVGFETFRMQMLLKFSDYFTNGIFIALLNLRP